MTRHVKVSICPGINSAWAQQRACPEVPVFVKNAFILFLHVKWSCVLSKFERVRVIHLPNVFTWGEKNIWTWEIINASTGVRWTFTRWVQPWKWNLRMQTSLNLRPLKQNVMGADTHSNAPALPSDREDFIAPLQHLVALSVLWRR